MSISTSTNRSWLDAMKLYLSSYYLGDEPSKLRQLLPHSSKIALILNAGDYRPADPSERQNWLSQQISSFEDLGYAASELDLRGYFNKDPEVLRQELERFGMVWLTGGNSFTLRRAMRMSGFDGVVTEMVENNQIVYGGFSAGACVATPTLRGIDLCDDPNASTEGYDPAVIWEGLGFVPFSIVPHYDSDHPESYAMNAVIAELEKLSLPYRTLRDGEVIIVNS